MSSQSVAKYVHERIIKNETEVQICDDILDNCVAPDTKGDGTGCDNMTAIVVKLSDEFRKKLPKCKDKLSGCYKHIEDVSEDTGIGFGGLHPEAPQSLEFTNKSDGSSQMIGEFLIKYPMTDYSWDQSSKCWSEVEVETHITSGKKNGKEEELESNSDDEKPPSKKKKT